MSGIIILVLLTLIFLLYFEFINISNYSSCEYFVIFIISILLYDRMTSKCTIYDDTQDLYYGGTLARAARELKKERVAKSAKEAEMETAKKAEAELAEANKENKIDYVGELKPNGEISFINKIIDEPHDMNKIYEAFIYYVNLNVDENEEFDILILPLNNDIIKYDIQKYKNIKPNVKAKLQNEFDKYKNKTNIGKSLYLEKLDSLNPENKLFIFGDKDIKFYVNYDMIDKNIHEKIIDRFNNITRLRYNVYYMLNIIYRRYFIFYGKILCSAETNDIYVQVDPPNKIDKIYTLNKSNEEKKVNMWHYDEFILNPKNAKKYIFDKDERTKYDITEPQATNGDQGKDANIIIYPNMANHEEQANMPGEIFYGESLDISDRSVIAENEYIKKSVKNLHNKYDNFKNIYYKPIRAEPNINISNVPNIPSVPNEDKGQCVIC